MDLHTIFDTGDELVAGPLRGVRFWRYQFVDPRSNHLFNQQYANPPRNIASFQHDIEWFANRPAESDMAPTMENERGLNVYKTIDDAMRGSADAVNGVLESLDRWTDREAGLVLGAVEFHGPTVEHEFGYHAQYVKPFWFLRAWGAKPKQIVDDLNVLWFADSKTLTFTNKVMLAIQRGGAVCAVDITPDALPLWQTREALSALEDRDFVSWKHGYFFNDEYKRQLDIAWGEGECLTCNRPARADGACARGRPRLYQITAAGQDALLVTLRGGKS